ncbi:MFS transporter [Arthrobacter sp. DNA4]|uniref:MFS transporter n=1 Tax=Micrococcaceae TaxID=1268 RepID=UPI0020CD76C7|nr:MULTISPECIES: MFS transporter [Micrococcaceae]UTT71193.1 MFS transporter [Arthrobacter sp. DNA4]WRT15662.1 MFS transporter [Pseudarthrobacter sp. LT1]
MMKTNTTPIDLSVEARVFRKVTLKVLPILMLGMFIAYIDRANLGVIAGPLSKDLGLTAATFGLAAGFFYIGYLLFEIPSNMFLAKVGARIWLARIMITWGLVTMGMAFMQDEVSLHIMRFLLGLAEAGYSPGTALFLALWCPARLLPKAMSWLNLAVPVALAVGSVVTSSIMLMNGVAGLAGWRWVFLIEGVPAIILAVVIFFALPSTPAKAAWLDDEEKAYLAENVTQRSGSGAHELKQLPAALRRPSLWAFAITYFFILIGFWSITYFLPTIVKEQFHLDVVGSGYVSAIPWAFSAIVMFVIVRSISRTGERRWHLTLPMVAAALGLLIGVLSGNPFLSLIGISIAAAGFFATLSTFQATVAQVYAGALAAVSIALVNSVGNVSGLVGPYIQGWLTDLTGSSSAGLLVMSGFFGLAAVFVYILIGWADRKTGGLRGTTSLETDVAGAHARG